MIILGIEGNSNVLSSDTIILKDIIHWIIIPISTIVGFIIQHLLAVRRTRKEQEHLFNLPNKVDGNYAHVVTYLMGQLLGKSKSYNLRRKTKKEIGKVLELLNDGDFNRALKKIGELVTTEKDKKVTKDEKELSSQFALLGFYLSKNQKNEKLANEYFKYLGYADKKLRQQKRIADAAFSRNELNKAGSSYQKIVDNYLDKLTDKIKISINTWEFNPKESIASLNWVSLNKELIFDSVIKLVLTLSKGKSHRGSINMEKQKISLLNAIDLIMDDKRLIYYLQSYCWKQIFFASKSNLEKKDAFEQHLYFAGQYVTAVELKPLPEEVDLNFPLITDIIYANFYYLIAAAGIDISKDELSDRKINTLKVAIEGYSIYLNELTEVPDLYQFVLKSMLARVHSLLYLAEHKKHNYDKCIELINTCKKLDIPKLERMSDPIIIRNRDNQIEDAHPINSLVHCSYFEKLCGLKKTEIMIYSCSNQEEIALKLCREYLGEFHPKDRLSSPDVKQLESFRKTLSQWEGFLNSRN